MNVDREERSSRRRMDRIRRELERWSDPRTWPFSRIWLATPDLCLSWANYWKLGWRYLRRRDARKGHLCLSAGWIRATVAW